MSKPASVAICIPSYGEMKILSVCSLVLASNFLRAGGHELTLHVRTGPYTHWNRDHLVNDARQANPDYLMFLDTDIIFPTDGINRLLERRKDIIGGIYNLKQEQPVSTVKIWNDDRTAFADRPMGPSPEEPFEVASVATGFMLIDMSVFDRLTAPYFPCDYGSGVGEDVAFCLAAGKAGCEVWCDPTVALQHIGDKHY